MKRFSVCAAIFGMACASMLSTPLVSAKAAMLASGLSTSPLRTELTMAAGTENARELLLTNNSAAPITIHMDAEKFSVTDKHYDYSFDPTAYISQWVSFSQNDFTIMPGQSQDVKYTIDIPVSGDPGAKYLALFATTDAQGNGSVKSQQRIASLVYLTVSGDVTRTGRLVLLTTPWLTSGQDKWAMDIGNSGTDHFHSQYGVSEGDLFGNKVGSYAANALILSSSVRTVTGVLPEPRWPGIYKAVYVATLGDSPAASQTRLFVYVPLWSVGVLIVGVGMILGTVFYIRSMRKDEN